MSWKNEVAELRRRRKLAEQMGGAEKVARIPVKVIPTETLPRKPDWIRVRVPASPEVTRIKEILRRHKLASVCEEAACPNLGECFSGGTATFMIMGEICTRRCPFCDVAHGRPNPLDAGEPRGLAEAIAEMKLRYVVVTSVDRDDLHDGGAAHFAACIRETRALNPGIRVEVLVPDGQGCCGSLGFHSGELERAREQAASIHQRLLEIADLVSAAIERDGARTLPLLDALLGRLRDDFRDQHGAFAAAPETDPS